MNELPLEAPKKLSKKAKEIWVETVQILKEKGIGTEADIRPLMMYCEEMAMYWELTPDIISEGPITELKTKGGAVINYMANPKIKLRDVCLKNAMLIGVQFGLTPLSVGKIKHKPKREETPEERNIDKLMKLRKMA